MIEEHFGERAIQFKMSDYPGREILSNLEGVTDVFEGDEGEIILYTGSIPITISALLVLVEGRETALSELSIRQSTLEDVFIKLTGKRIRD